MKKVIAPRKNKLDIKDFRHKMARPQDCTFVVEEECNIHDSETDELLFSAITLDADLCSNLYSGINRIKKWVTSTRASGMVNTSKVFGYQPRSPTHRQNYCTSAMLAVEQPDLEALLKQSAEVVDSFYQQQNPILHAYHKEQMSIVLPEWRMGSSVFTSGIINNDNVLTYHLDRGNFSGTWSNMIVLKNQVDGGHLCLPEYNLRFTLPDRTLAMFDGQSLIHGVTPFRKMQLNSHRYSVVFYSLEQMKICLSKKEEIRRAQKLYS